MWLFRACFFQDYEKVCFFFLFRYIRILNSYKYNFFEYFLFTTKDCCIMCGSILEDLFSCDYVIDIERVLTRCIYLHGIIWILQIRYLLQKRFFSEYNYLLTTRSSYFLLVYYYAWGFIFISYLYWCRSWEIWLAVVQYMINVPELYILDTCI